MLPVHDLQRAVVFYTTGLGLQLKFKKKGWVELAWGVDCIIALRAGSNEHPRYSGLTFQVEDIICVVEALVGLGANIMVKPAYTAGQSVVLAELMDPEGNRFFLSQTLKYGAKNRR